MWIKHILREKLTSGNFPVAWHFTFRTYPRNNHRYVRHNIRYYLIVKICNWPVSNDCWWFVMCSDSQVHKREQGTQWKTDFAGKLQNFSYQNKQIKQRKKKGASYHYEMIWELEIQNQVMIGGTSASWVNVKMTKWLVSKMATWKNWVKGSQGLFYYVRTVNEH